ncbi:MAG: Gfo/Idh/MocA family oxidoreductase, partial [Kiritimatiellae bacterium]|nr:Gfo/Idh/MocA family oxidoreductase [Kiritimatiellia bacterium]
MSATAALAGMPGILRAQEAPAVDPKIVGANNRVRVACVGFSDRFRSSLLPCFLGNAKDLNFDLVAVADLWKKRLNEEAIPKLKEKTGHDIVGYGSDVELYEKGKDIDAVIISTADFQHAQHAAHAVNAGKDAYCEKPLAEDMYSANMLLDAVNAKRNAGFAPGAVLQIGSQRRSGKSYQAAKEYINSGAFGDISYVDLRWNVNQPRRWRRSDNLIKSLKKEDIDWDLWLLDRDPEAYPFDPRKYLEFRLFWPFSSGTPGQWMCHQIDTVAWFTGFHHPTSAVSSGGLYQWVDGRVSYDTFTTVLEYGESGVKGKGFQCVFQSHQHNCGGGSNPNRESPIEKYFG